MKQIKDYGDERMLAFCAFCGGETGTRDHCPSRVFLDEPFPENLSVVPACSRCNTSFSADEEYLACLISCVLAGSTEPSQMPRSKVTRILNRKPALRARIEACRLEIDGETIFKPEIDRVSAIITKLAKGHALYELHESCGHEPNNVSFFPLMLLNEADREGFENPQVAEIWPEVGSRAMQRILTRQNVDYEGWIIVQPERYRYAASAGDGIDIRIVIQEYLGCHVQWLY